MKLGLIRIPTRWALAGCAFLAALLSALYIHAYLRGGSRIIDATSYMLSARAIARGYFCFPAPDPIASAHGRFLILNESPSGPCLSVLFPPGYPAFLSLFIRAGIPMAQGPLLAAAITIATFDLARYTIKSESFSNENEYKINLIKTHLPVWAAIFSVFCAVLRYHTADTMSHGLSALCFTLALSFAFRAASTASFGPSLISGLFLGFLCSARPISGAACALAIALILGRSPARLRPLFPLALGLLPGLLLFFAHQYSATGGQFGMSSQQLYYALADGPPNCFRYGFGQDIGCLQEHGDFVRHNLPSGFDAWPAAKTTLRRLKMHLADPLNASPLILIPLLGAYYSRKYKRICILFFAILFQIAAYIPFYFDGNYPGGGARFYADILPFEHILCALALIEIAAALKQPPHRALSIALALSLLGFALQTSRDHAHLRDREGGQPKFDPSHLSPPTLTQNALLFLDSDYGFNLAFEPSPTHPGHPHIARFQGDILDYWAWQSLGFPPAYRYRIDHTRPSPITIESYSPKPVPILEGEHLWPAYAQHNAWAIPAWTGPACLSDQRFMAIHTKTGQTGHADLLLPKAQLEGKTITLHVVGPATPNSSQIQLIDAARILHTWTPPSTGEQSACHALPPITIPNGLSQLKLRLIHSGHPDPSTFGLDKIDIQSSP